MSDSNPSAATAAGLQQSPEIQQLIGLLGNLMPLLLRFQTPGLEQPFLAGAGSFPVPDPALDQQAAVNLVSDSPPIRCAICQPIWKPMRGDTRR
jgi:hypothetical protein